MSAKRLILGIEQTEQPGQYAIWCGPRPEVPKNTILVTGDGRTVYAAAVAHLKTHFVAAFAPEAK